MPTTTQFVVSGQSKTGCAGGGGGRTRRCRSQHPKPFPAPEVTGPGKPRLMWQMSTPPRIAPENLRSSSARRPPLILSLENKPGPGKPVADSLHSPFQRQMWLWHALSKANAQLSSTVSKYDESARVLRTHSLDEF